MSGQGRGSETAFIRKIIGKCVVILAAGVAFGTLLLTLSYMLPVNTENRDITYEILDKEGWYPRTSTVSSKDGFFLSFYPDVLDNSSDKIMLTIAMDSSAGNPLVRAMESYSEYAGSYSYYWHGYVTILRPLLLFFNFSEIRMWNGVCQVLIIVLLGWLIGRQKGIGYVLALMTSYILLEPRTLSMGLQYSWVFYIAYGGTLVLLCKRNFFAQKQRFLYFFLITGMLTSYLDLLTYPLFTWGIPLVWWIMVQEERKASEWIKSVIGSGIVWIAGYAGMWTAKWITASAILRRNVLKAAVEEVFLRSGTSKAGMDNPAARWNAIYVNWRHYAYKMYMILLVGWLLWWVFCSLRKRWNKSGKRYAFFLIGLSAPVWYFVLSNHTMIHHLFTYRIFGISIMAFLALMLESVGTFREAPGLSGRGRAALFGFLGISAVLAYLCSLCAKEGSTVTNCRGPYRYEQVEQIMEMELMFPYNTIITEMDLSLESESTVGRYEVKLWKGGKLKYQNTLYLSDCSASSLQRFSPWWRLRRGETYRITVEPVGTDAPVLAGLKVEEDILPEFGDVSVDGVETGRQMMMGIHYMNRHQVPADVRILITLSWIGIFMAAGYTLWGTKCLWNKKRERE